MSNIHYELIYFNENNNKENYLNLDILIKFQIVNH